MSLKGQGALGLKSIEMRQLRSETKGFGRVMLRDLNRDYDKVFMDVD